MKAISLWQPWATAVALRSKRIETRHWSTRYRGPLAIHAAKRLNKGECVTYGYSPTWRGALHAAMGPTTPFRFLPTGAIVATCVLADCRPSESFSVDELALMHENESGEWCENDMGNFGPGRFGWVFEEIQPTRWPIPYRGLQGLFNVPDEVWQLERAA